MAVERMVDAPINQLHNRISWSEALRADAFNHQVRRESAFGPHEGSSPADRVPSFGQSRYPILGSLSILHRQP